MCKVLGSDLTTVCSLICVIELDGRGENRVTNDSGLSTKGSLRNECLHSRVDRSCLWKWRLGEMRGMVAAEGAGSEGVACPSFKSQILMLFLCVCHYDQFVCRFFGGSNSVSLGFVSEWSYWSYGSQCLPCEQLQMFSKVAAPFHTQLYVSLLGSRVWQACLISLYDHSHPHGSGMVSHWGLTLPFPDD